MSAFVTSPGGGIGRADHDRLYAALASRDPRFDGWFVAAITTTGIYCRPSCPAPVRPLRRNVRFFTAAAAAQRAGFRACKRCRPDAVPGSPEWDVRADLVGRAMRLVADGAVDREGVGGVARRLAVSERHLHRLLVAEVGAGPLDLARARRAQAARVLIETTAMPMADVAFAAGFSSVRQFNDTVRTVFAASPRELRRQAARGSAPAASAVAPPAGPPHEAGWAPEVSVRLPFRAPLDWTTLLAHLAARAVPGVEEVDGVVYRRSLRLPAGPAVVELAPAPDHVAARLRLASLADLATAVARCRRMLDLDADPGAVAEVLTADAALAPLLRRRPGLRAPGCADPVEAAVRVVLGQQVSVAAARGVAGRLTAAVGTPLARPSGAVTHLFPAAEDLAAADQAILPMPGSRARALHAVCAAVAGGDVTLDAGADRDTVARRLLDLRGVGPWTAAMVAMRALGDPDALPAGDLGVRRAAAAAGLPDDVGALLHRAEHWRPWRSYATQHLWASLTAPPTARDAHEAPRVTTPRRRPSRHRRPPVTQGAPR